MILNNTSPISLLGIIVDELLATTKFGPMFFSS